MARRVRILVVYPDGKREVIAEERVESEAMGPMAWSQTLARLAPLLTQAMLEQGHKIARAARLVFEMDLAETEIRGFVGCTEPIWVPCDAVAKALRKGKAEYGFSSETYLEYDGRGNLMLCRAREGGVECHNITEEAAEHCPDAFLEEAPGVAVLS